MRKGIVDCGHDLKRKPIPTRGRRGKVFKVLIAHGIKGRRERFTKIAHCPNWRKPVLKTEPDEKDLPRTQEGPQIKKKEKHTISPNWAFGKKKLTITSPQRGKYGGGRYETGNFNLQERPSSMEKKKIP